MAVLIVIPARYASTRYPGKPLVELAGATGEKRSLIRRSWDAAVSVPGVDRVVVATDDDRIAEAARAFGAEVAMTPDTCRNGTERCALVARDLAGPDDVVVNLQGDAPLTPALVRRGARRGDAGRPRPPRRHPGPALRRRGAGGLSRGPPPRAGSAPPPRSSTATGRALYFSKEVIPYTGRPLGPGRGDPGLPPRRRLRLPPGGARPLSRLADGPARDLGGARAAPLHGERPARPLRRGRGRAAAPSGSSTTRRDVPRIEAILRRLGPAADGRRPSARR